MRGYLSLVLVCAALLGGCASDTPAPVIDRAATSGATPSTEAVPTYVVKRGDTLYSIAREQRVELRDLMAWNNLTNSTRLSVGQALRLRAPAAAEPAPPPPVASGSPLVPPVLEAKPLPPPPGHAAVITMPPTATNAASANTGLLKTQPKGLKLPYSDQNLALLQKQDASAPATAPPSAVSAPPAPDAAPAPASAAAESSFVKDGIEWAWPAAGDVVARFSEGGRKGVDIAGREGEPVLAAAAGKVIHSGGGLRGYGNLVIIRHNAQYLSAYAHNKSIAVKQGQSVARGQKIAELGSTGTDAPKLHFEIRHQGTPVDPEAFLPPRR
jgi:lipoprotein NlpD